MVAVRNSLLCIALMVMATVRASESGNILDAFNQLSLEPPATVIGDWDPGWTLDTSEFQDRYLAYFDQYITLATRMSVRAIDCAEGKLTQAADYQPMTDLRALYSSLAGDVSQVQTQLRIWRDLDDKGALDPLSALLPSLNSAYSQMMFELSGCSGYRYGELVN